MNSLATNKLHFNYSKTTFLNLVTLEYMGKTTKLHFFYKKIKY